MQASEEKSTTAPRGNRLTPWLKLLVGILLYIFFTHVGGPLLLNLPAFGEMADSIEKKDIDATAIYYTDLEEFAAAEAFMRDNFAYYRARE